MTHTTPLAVSRRFRPGLQKTTWQSAPHPSGIRDGRLDQGVGRRSSTSVPRHASPSHSHLPRSRSCAKSTPPGFDSRNQSESWGIRGVTRIRSDRDQTRRCRDGPSTGLVLGPPPVRPIAVTRLFLFKPSAAPAVRAPEDCKTVSIFCRSGGGISFPSLQRRMAQQQRASEFKHACNDACHWQVTPPSYHLPLHVCTRTPPNCHWSQLVRTSNSVDRSTCARRFSGPGQEDRKYCRGPGATRWPTGSGAPAKPSQTSHDATVEATVIGGWRHMSPVHQRQTRTPLSGGPRGRIPARRTKTNQQTGAGLPRFPREAEAAHRGWDGGDPADADVQVWFGLVCGCLVSENFWVKGHIDCLIRCWEGFSGIN